MNYMLELAYIVGGFLGLLVGGNLLVQGAVSLARRLGISPMIIGLTLVGFGTSMPELVTSLQAAFAGSPGIAIGNIVGSNIANILLIIGASALIMPMVIHPPALKRDGSVLMAVSILCTALLLWGQIGPATGLVLLAALVAYVLFTIISEKRNSTAAVDVYEGEAATIRDTDTSALRDGMVLLIGMVITILSARFLVSGAISIAASYGVPDAVIGLTVVAVGTSLPELITSVLAARRGQADVALGNVIGSNIFNILGILGITALIRPITVPAQFVALDIWVMLTATTVLLVFARTGWRIGRREGGVMLALYIAYTGYLLSTI